MEGQSPVGDNFSAEDLALAEILIVEHSPAAWPEIAWCMKCHVPHPCHTFEQIASAQRG